MHNTQAGVLRFQLSSKLDISYRTWIHIQMTEDQTFIILVTSATREVLAVVNIMTTVFWLSLTGIQFGVAGGRNSWLKWTADWQTVWLLNRCWPLSSQWFLIRGPTRLMTIFYCLAAIGGVKRLTLLNCFRSSIWSQRKHRILYVESVLLPRKCLPCSCLATTASARSSIQLSAVMSQYVSWTRVVITRFQNP
jgi:hypothetical protein